MDGRIAQTHSALRRRYVGALTAAAALAGAVAIGAYASPSAQASTHARAAAAKPKIILGDKNFTEEFVLGDIYAEAFRAKGYTVVLKPNIGSSELINRLLQSGQINAYPEYLGEIASSLAGYSKPLTSEAQTLSLSQKYEKKHGFTVMSPVTPFQDRDEIAALKSFATKHHLTSITQLKKLGPLKLADYSAEQTRYEGYVGLKKAYGATNLQFVPLEEGGPIYQALDSGQAQVGDVFSTDPELLSGKYTALSDPKNIMGFQHVAMVIKASLLHQLGSKFQHVYSAVTKLLTTPVMQALNKAVAVDKLSPASVAHKFLQENHLL